MNGNAISLIVGLASLGLGIVAFLEPDLRPAALMMIAFLLGVVLLYLEVLGSFKVFREFIRRMQKIEQKFHDFEEKQDIYKKIYKLEARVKNTMRKGEFRPAWGIAILAIVILIVFILLATGVF